MRGIAVFGALVIVMAGASGVRADDRTPVTLKFTLVEYRNDFPGLAQAIEAEAAARIIARLARHVAFLKFLPAGASPYVLGFELKAVAPPDHAGAPREVHHRITLTGPSGTAAEDHILFRGLDEFGKGVGDKAALVAEIDVKLDNDDSRARLTKLLSKVPIASSGEVWRDPPGGWILPYRRADLCMEYESQLEIVTSVTTSAGPIPYRLKAIAVNDFQPQGATSVDRFRGHIFCVPAAEARAQFQADLLAATGAANVTGVWVKEYHLDETCHAEFGR